MLLSSQSLHWCCCYCFYCLYHHCHCHHYYEHDYYKRYVADVNFDVLCICGTLLHLSEGERDCSSVALPQVYSFPLNCFFFLILFVLPDPVQWSTDKGCHICADCFTTGSVIKGMVVEGFTSSYFFLNMYYSNLQKHMWNNLFLLIFLFFFLIDFLSMSFVALACYTIKCFQSIKQ